MMTVVLGASQKAISALGERLTAGGWTDDGPRRPSYWFLLAGSRECRHQTPGWVISHDLLDGCKACRRWESLMEGLSSGCIPHRATGCKMPIMWRCIVCTKLTWT